MARRRVDGEIFVVLGIHDVKDSPLGKLTWMASAWNTKHEAEEDMARLLGDLTDRRALHHRATQARDKVLREYLVDNPPEGIPVYDLRALREKYGINPDDEDHDYLLPKPEEHVPPHVRDEARAAGEAVMPGFENYAGVVGEPSRYTIARLVMGRPGDALAGLEVD